MVKSIRRSSSLTGPSSKPARSSTRPFATRRTAASRSCSTPEEITMTTNARRLAVVTGASTGIGYQLARIAAEQGYDLVIAADEPEIEDAANDLRGMGADVWPVEADLATARGVDELYDVIRQIGRPVDALLANAGRGLGNAFFDQDVDDWRRVLDTNV